MATTASVNVSLDDIDLSSLRVSLLLFIIVIVFFFYFFLDSESINNKKHQIFCFRPKFLLIWISSADLDSRNLDN